MPSTQRTDDRQPLGRLLSIAEVAEALGVEVRHVRRLVHEKRIPYIKWATCSASTPETLQSGSTRIGVVRGIHGPGSPTDRASGRWAT
jgi:hypothetical protein